MIHENIRLFRLYCGLTQKAVAESVNLSLDRYRLIELGEVEPSEAEAERIAKLYNIEADDLFKGITESEKFVVTQDIDDNVFLTPELKELAKMTITSLSTQEKQIILLLRQAKDRDRIMHSIREMLLEEME